MSQAVVPTVALITIHDIGALCQYWIRDRSLFLQARPLVGEIHFNHYPQFAAVFRALCLSSDQFGSWNVATLAGFVNELASQMPEALLPGQLPLLTTQAEGGFIFDAWVRGALDNVEQAHARELQERFLREMTVVRPLRNFVNPDRLSNCCPASVREFMQAIQIQDRRISAQSVTPPQSALQLWDSHEQALEQLRGRRMIGLETGLSSLDQKLLGLRGVTLLGAAPGVGKTVLCMQLALGVCENYQTNGAIVVFISLELSTDAILTRLKSHLTQLEWKVYTRGAQQPDGQLAFTGELVNIRQQARNRMVEANLGHRFYVVDRQQISDHSADQIVGIVESLKRQAGVEKALVILDYLQLLELPEADRSRSDLDADKARFRVVQQICERTRTAHNPFGDAVLAVSEARKPVGDTRRNQMWGTALADLMGTARLGYGADAALFLHRMTSDELNRHHGENSEDVETRLERMREQGISPLILSIVKGRDGMTQGEVPLDFDFRRSTMTEVQNRRLVPRPTIRSGRRTSPGDQHVEVTQ